MKILCMMQFVPMADGVGGEQRAWFTLKALAQLGEVHLVIARPSKPDGRAVDIEGLRSLAASVVDHRIAGWSRLSDLVPAVHRQIGVWFDYLKMGTPHTPKLRHAELKQLADRLSRHEFDVVFAGRLPMAMVFDHLQAAGLIQAKRRIVDFDDILSRFFVRELSVLPWSKPYRKIPKMIDVGMVVRAENRILDTWDAVGVCSEGDVEILKARNASVQAALVPNVVDRPLLQTTSDTAFRILFVGNLGFGPNTHGLNHFLDEVWPGVRERVANVSMQVVGRDPAPALASKLGALGISLTANAPSVEPFYQNADLVIAPIYFGSGTRIKILEAMAYGRPIVTTPIGADGLSLTNGSNAMIADTAEEFVNAIVRLYKDPVLRNTMSRNAKAYQEQAYGWTSMLNSIRDLLTGDADGANASKSRGGSANL